MLYDIVQIVFLVFITHMESSSQQDWKLVIGSPLCDCGNDTETTTHFFLHCPSFHIPRQTLLNNIRNINEQILSHGEDQLIQMFLYGNPNFNLTVNRLILNATTEHLISTKRFKRPLFN